MGFFRRRRRKVKLPSFLMEGTRSLAISRKQKQNLKQKKKGMDGADKQMSSDNGGIDKITDDVLIDILSHLSLKEAARASVIARRWRYLWRFMYGSLQFDSTGVLELGKFESWVNTVLKLHQGRYIESLGISLKGIEEEYFIGARTSRAIDSWVYFALHKEVHRFELILSHGDKYEFPSIEMLHSRGVSSPLCRLRTLRLANVDIEDEVVHYLLASCVNLEELHVSCSSVTKNLQVVGPPSLRVLEISQCLCIQGAEISATNLVSLAYGGGGNGLLLKNLPNLCELTIRDELYYTFVSKPKEQSWYFDQLVKLVVDTQEMILNGPIVTLPEWPQFCSLKCLEVRVISIIGRSLLFFTSLINASPQLCEFRIQISYSIYFWLQLSEEMPFPDISSEEAVKFDHKSLKVVEIAGFIGCSSEEQLLLELFENGPLIEKVVIDTESDYYDNPQLTSFLISRNEHPRMFERLEMGAATQSESKERATRLVSTFPQQIEFTVI